MRFITLGIILPLAFAASGSALAAAPAELSNAELQTLFKPYAAAAAELDVDFRQSKTIKGLKRPLLSEGHLRVRRPDFVQWTVLKPSYLQAQMQGRKMTLTTGQGNAARTQTVPESETGSLSALVAWMRFDIHQLAKDYRVRDLGSRWYSFEPRDPPAVPLEKIDVELGAKGHLKTLVLHEKSGDQIEIKFDPPQVKTAK